MDLFNLFLRMWNHTDKKNQYVLFNMAGAETQEITPVAHIDMGSEEASYAVALLFCLAPSLYAAIERIWEADIWSPTCAFCKCGEGTGIDHKADCVYHTIQELVSELEYL